MTEDLPEALRRALNGEPAQQDLRALLSSHLEPEPDPQAHPTPLALNSPELTAALAANLNKNKENYR